MPLTAVWLLEVLFWTITMLFNDKDESVLFVSAHPDDAEIFAGGTIAKLVRQGIDVQVVVLSDGSKGGNGDTRIDEFHAAMDSLGVLEPNRWVMNFNDTRFFEEENKIVDQIEYISKKMKVSTVFTHHPFDIHQDHRVAATASLAASRNIKNVLFYCPSWPSGRPTVPFSSDFIVSLNPLDVDAKINALFQYKSQIKKYGADDYLESHRALLKANSMTQTGNMNGSAEVFEINRVVYD